MLHLAKFMPALTGAAAKRAFGSSSAILGNTARNTSQGSVIESFEMLPPGCSIKDPTYGLNDETTVVHYDTTAGDGSQAAATAPKKTVPKTPRNMAAAQKKLDDSKDAEENEPYVYLPPGCSLKEPGYNSMSDPLDNKIFYRDPVPDVKKH